MFDLQRHREPEKKVAEGQRRGNAMAGWLAGWLARTLGRKRSLAAVGVGRRRGPGGRGPRWRGRPRRRRVESRGSGVLDNAAGARHLVLMMIHRAVAFVRVAVAGTEEGSGGTACD